jgi:transcription initiation factor TFIID TATA-box-binding protein
MVDPVPSLTIENVVASTGIDQELDLATLAGDLEPAQYDPDRFPGLVYRMQEPKAAALIFRSGKMVVTGAGSRTAVGTAVERIFDAFRDLDIPVPADADFTVQNIVTSGDLGHQLNLNAIAIGLGLAETEYEPEQFPGLVYRPPEGETVTLLFSSGKIVITGGRHPDAAEETISNIHQQLGDLGLLDST